MSSWPRLRDRRLDFMGLYRLVALWRRGVRWPINVLLRSAPAPRKQRSIVLDTL